MDDVVCELQSPTCPCAPPAGTCPTTLQVDITGTQADIDIGWTGILQDQPKTFFDRLTVGVGGCANANHPCGQCTLSGPLPNAGGVTFNNHRCVGDTSIQCNVDADCGVDGPCHFFLGAPLPLSAGGVSLCLTNDINGPVTGTADPDGGTSAIAVPLVWRFHAGITIDQGCPVCVSGTCNGGDRHGLGCTVNGFNTFGAVSFDCPPLTGGLFGILRAPLDLRTGTQTRVLSAANPNCTAPGFTGSECLCDTCNNNNEEPCGSNAECPDPPGPIGPICGGRRCLGGTNDGAACSTTNSECPGGGVCGRPGAATAPNPCDDGVCSPNGADTDSCDEGQCAAGPFDNLCAIETFRGCISNADCPAPGDTCTGGKFRDCYTDNGGIGDDVQSCGSPGTVCGEVASDTVVSSLTCVPPTSAGAINIGAGLPGLGRVTLPTVMTFN